MASSGFDRVDFLYHALGQQIVHAFEMPQRAFARVARAAFDSGPNQRAPMSVEKMTYDAATGSVIYWLP